jgi:aspartate/methionine/tyrosine aminotransferase
MTSPITEAYSWVESLDPVKRQDLLDVSQAVPGYPPPQSLREAIARAALEPASARYTEQLGLQELRSELAQDIQRLYRPDEATPTSTFPDGSNVGIVAGCNQAFCLTVMSLTEPGDQVLLPLPYYFNHTMWLELLGVEPSYLPALTHPRASGETSPQLLPDIERAASLITERTRAIVLVTPNNPSGTVYPPELIEAFYDLAREHGLALILDETYRDFRDDTSPPHRLFEHEDWSQTLVQLYSFSKVFCLTGYRVGAITASTALLDEAAKAMDCVAICPPHIGQLAALEGLRTLHDWKEGNRKLMKSRLDEFLRLLEASDCGYAVRAAGAYFAYVSHPFSQESSSQVARRLAQKHGILTLSGSMFGPDQDAYLRLAFANLDQEAFPELVARLQRSTA